MPFPAAEPILTSRSPLLDSTASDHATPKLSSTLLTSTVSNLRPCKRPVYFVTAGVIAICLSSALLRANVPMDPAWVTPRVAFHSALKLPFAQHLQEPADYLSSYLPAAKWPPSMNGLELSKHPIPKLIAKAQRKWAEKVAGQSQTLSEARMTYIERYESEPPQGFNDWFAKASKRKHLMLDEYDQLMDRVSLFARFTPEEIVERAWAIGTQPTYNLVHITKGKVSITCTNAGDHVPKDRRTFRAEGLKLLLQHIADRLPDMTFPVSELADPRVLPSWEEVIADRSPSINITRDFPSLKLDIHQTWWDIYKQTCHPSSAARRKQSRSSLLLSNVAFWRSKYTEFQDKLISNGAGAFCSNLKHHELHSQFYQEYRPVATLYPVFGFSTMQNAADIPFPSRYYLNWLSDRYQFEGKPKAFQDKKSQIYWRGTVNPSYNNPPLRQADFPRRRFLELASTSTNVAHTIMVTHPDDTTGTIRFAKHNSTTLNAEVMDVAFTTLQIEQCGPQEACKSFYESGHYRRIDGHAALNEVDNYKFLLDLDGLSYSARFQALLASGGVVLKSTIYDEFYSDWIQPWLHFIPLSMTFDEIYDIYAYFIGTKMPTHRPLAAMIREEMLANIGVKAAEWKRTNFRKEDLELYVERMSLEWAKLYRGPHWIAGSPDPYYEKHIAVIRKTADCIVD